jgi:transposase
MSQLDEIVERVRRDANALYTFVLTRRGQMVTRGALREVPPVTGGAITAAADVVAGSDRVVTVRLAHHELVPGAGSEPVDCHVGVAAERAIVCLVMRGGADVRRASTALQVGVRAIEPMLARALTKAEGQKKGAPSSRQGKDTGPQIAVEPARKVGASTLKAIEKEMQKGDQHVPNPHIPREVLRTTLPWKSTPDAPEPAEPQAKPPTKPKR